MVLDLEGERAGHDVKQTRAVEVSERYAIASLVEARAYLEHPTLGPRLRDCARILTDLSKPPRLTSSAASTR